MVIIDVKTNLLYIHKNLTLTNYNDHATCFPFIKRTLMDYSFLVPFLFKFIRPSFCLSNSIIKLSSVLKVSWFRNVFCGILNSSKNERKKSTLLLYTNYDTSCRIVFVCFLEELKTPKTHFEINWPLELSKKDFKVFFVSNHCWRKMCQGCQKMGKIVRNQKNTIPRRLLRK